MARFSFGDIRRIRVHEAISSKIVFDAGLLNRRWMIFLCAWLNFK